MRKRVILALLLVVVLAVTASCKLIAKDEEVDKSTVIIQVGDTAITKQEVQNEVDSTLYMTAYQYYMYGMSYDTADAEHIRTARETAISNLTKDAVVALKVKELGTALTDDEIAALQTELDETYAGYVENVRTTYFAETELTGDDLEAAVLQKAEELYGTKDSLLASKKDAAVTQKLKDSVVADVAVTDEEIQSQYESLVNRAMQDYATQLTYYASDVSNGSTIYYVPDGYRYVKNLLIKFDEADATAITDKTTELTTAQSQLESITTALADLPEDPATDTEDQATSRASLLEQQTALQTQVQDATTQLEQLKKDAVAKIQPTIDEIQAKLTAGETFDALLEQYGQDDGMKQSPAKEQGYLVCAGLTTYVTEFTEASMALAKVGDVSAPVQTSYGLHLIQYASEVPQGAVPLETVKDTVQQSLLTSKQDTLYNTTVDTWVSEANVKTYPERMDQ